MVLENVKEMWTEVPKTGKGKKKSKPVNKDRCVLLPFQISGILFMYKDQELTFGLADREQFTN